MKHPIIRSAAVAIGAIVVLAAVAGLMFGGLAGSRSLPESTRWTIPLVAGAAVGVLSLLLLTGTAREDESDSRRVNVICPSCGMQVLEDWRLCPYCGGSKERVISEGESPAVTPHPGA